MKIFISFLFFLTFAILIAIYVNISKPQINLKEIAKQENLTKEKSEIKKPIIYNFPAKVLAMHIDFRKYKYIYLYRAILNVKDRYELFNIKVILDNFNLIYSLAENKKNEKIYILFRNLNEAKKVLDIFKEYNFKIKIEKIKQRI